MKNVETVAIEFWVDLGEGSVKLERLEIPIPHGSGPYAQSALIQGIQEKFFVPMGQTPFDGESLLLSERNVAAWTSQHQSRLFI